MKQARKNIMQVGTKIGAAIGIGAFLAFGIVPGFYFGSFGTLMILNHLMGPVEATTIVRMLTVVGSILGIFCTGAVSIVLGSVFGTAVGYVVDVAGGLSKVTAEDTAEAKVHN
jgi:hypothetical protein